MRPLFAALCAIGLLPLASAQTANLQPFKMSIHHADPWVVKALIEGVPVRIPEMSTIPGFGGMMSRAVGATTGLLQDGYLVVNPTDNSLWWYPKH